MEKKEICNGKKEICNGKKGDMQWEKRRYAMGKNSNFLIPI